MAQRKPDGEQDIIVVTGSSGLLGHAVVKNLVGEYDVMGFDRIGPPSPPDETEYIVLCDMASDESVQQAMNQVRELRGPRIVSVIHLAAYYNFSGEPSPLYEEVTVKGTERLLSELKDFEVGQFIFSSTMLVHAPCQPGERINEEWPLEPKWDYPQSKVTTENLIRAQSGDIPIVLMRIAGVYNESGHSIPLAQQIQRIYERDLTSMLYPGDLSHGQSFVHLDDVVDALRKAVDKRHDLPVETVLLIGEPDTVSYGDLQHEFGRLIHGEDTDWETHRIPETVAKAGAWIQDTPPYEAITGQEPFIKPWMIELADDHYALDISRAREMIGWEPKHSLRDSLPEMVANLKANPAQWYEENELDAPSWVEEQGQAEAGNAE